MIKKTVDDYLKTLEVDEVEDDELEYDELNYCIDDVHVNVVVKKPCAKSRRVRSTCSSSGCS